MKMRFSYTYSISVLVVLSILLPQNRLWAALKIEYAERIHLQDTVVPILLDSVFEQNFKNLKAKSILKSPTDLSINGFASITGYLKGEAPGLLVTEPNGEPGTINPMYIRGISVPVFSQKDLYQNQPLVVLDNIPLIGTHPFSSIIQEYDIDQIGPENNLFSNLELDNIASIEILKDPAGISIYGPQGANGVIKITSKKRASDNKKRISLN